MNNEKNMTADEVLAELFEIMEVKENADIRERAKELMEKEWMYDSLAN